MKALILLLIFLNFLNQSNQLDCSAFSDDNCGDHNYEIDLKCHNFGSGCEEVEVDDGCEINSSHQCVAKSISNKEKCVSNGRNKCKKVKKSCSDYSDSNCGGLQITNNNQCIQLNVGDPCTEYHVDIFCQFSTDNSHQCTKRESYQSNNNIICVQDGNYCHRKTCGSQSIDNCNSIENCYKVMNQSSTFCSEVDINDKCSIDSNGQCKDKVEDTTEKCEYNEDFDKCQPRKRLCEEFTICSNFVPPNSNKVCTSIDSRCKLIDIDSSCKIGEDGSCQLKTESDNKACLFNTDNTKCQLININTLCKIDNTGICTKKDLSTNTDKKCEFNEAHTECQFVDKECEDYDNASCESISKGNSKKCSIKNSLNCQEYTVDQYCTVTGGSCVVKKDVTLGATEECLFDKIEESCKKKTKICSNYYKQEDCQKFEITTTSQCAFNADGYCKEIRVDEYCNVVYNHGIDQCTKRDSASFDEKDGICAYDDEEKRTSCKRRTRKCTEYTKNDCQSIKNCFYYNSKCYETDNYCVIDSKGDCVEKEGANLSSKEKCSKDNINKKCMKIKKTCSDYGSNNCADFERTKELQCFNINHGTYCDTVELDGNCYVNGDGKCVALSSVKLTANEICAFNSAKSACKKREKQCSDIIDDTCGDYSPLSKLCFKFDEFETCKEVKVDSGCEVDDNECTGQNCSFDKDKNKCAKKSSSSKSIKLNSLIILLSFFIF